MIVNHYPLKPGEYLQKPKDWPISGIVLHHTAGRENPFKTVDDWNSDKRGRIGTPFVIGGISVKGDKTHDGVIVKSMYPESMFAYHLGVNDQSLNGRLIGIELCSAGSLTDGKSWFGEQVEASQIVTLKNKFRGVSQFHKYSDMQITQLKDVLISLTDQYDIDPKMGLMSFLSKLKTPGAAFGKITNLRNGVFSHTNYLKTKTDVFPQQELIDMLSSL